MTLGQKIKNKRKQDRLSAEDLAILLGLKKDNIYKWERGSTPSNPEEYEKINNWLSNKLENVPQETAPPAKSMAYDALFSVLIAEVAYLKAKETGEHPQVIERRMRKAGEDVLKLS